MPAPLAGLTAGGKIPPFPGDSKAGKHPFKKQRPPKTRDELTRALDAHDRIQAISDRIRAERGLEPLPENGIVTGWRSALAAAPRKAAAKRQAKATAAAPADPVAELERRRRAHEREAAALRADAVALFRDKVAGATAIGQALGVKRQRVYQLAEAL